MSTVQQSDVLPVRSRVSWGAILAGAFIALAVYILLQTLGVALGITLNNNTNVDAENLALGEGIWAAASMLIALFAGGCVASRCTAGETKMEAVMYGVVVWGVFLSFLVIFAMGAAGLGIAAAVNVGNTPAGARLSDDAFRRAGFTDAQIRENREQFDRLGTAATPEGMRMLIRDPRTTAAAWWTFVGLLLSVTASVGGALVGSGPELITRFLRVRSVAVTQGGMPGEAVPR